MGEVERVRASYGASFGGYGPRVSGAADRNPKKHHQPGSEHHAKDDALELHEESGQEATPQVIHLPIEQDEHLDFSA